MVGRKRSWIKMLLYGESHSADNEFSDQDIGNFGVQEKGGLESTTTISNLMWSFAFK